MFVYLLRLPDEEDLEDETEGAKVEKALAAFSALEVVSSF